MSGGPAETFGHKANILRILAARSVLGDSQVVPGLDKAPESLMEGVDLAETLNQCLGRDRSGDVINL